MPTHLKRPSIIQAAGNVPKIIEEFVGHVNSGTSGVSIARMQSAGGWIEPGQRPEFDEFTIVVRGMLQVRSESGTMEIRAGEAVIAHKGEWVQYSTPESDGAEYFAICIPAFSMDTVHRDAS